MADRVRHTPTKAKGLSYTINTVADPIGSVLTNETPGGSLVAFILPKAGAGLLNGAYRFRMIVDQPMTIGVTAGDRMITLGDGNAQQYNLTTIGSELTVECIRIPNDGYAWFASASGSGGGSTGVTGSAEITVNNIRMRPVIEQVGQLKELALQFHTGIDWEDVGSRSRK